MSSDDEKQQELVTQGKRLYDEARTSNFIDSQDKLIKCLKCFVEAAGEHSKEAVSYIKPFFTENDLENDIPSSVIKELPTDLMAVAHMLMEGTQEEREVYSVARDMFETMSEGVGFILKKDFKESIERLLKEERQFKHSIKIDRLRMSVKRLLHCGLSSNNEGERMITVEAFCLIACRYARGEVLMQSLEEETTFELSSEQLSDFKQSNWIKKATDFPLQTGQYLVQYVLRAIEKRGVRWIWTLFPLRQFFLVLLVYVIPLINIEFMLSVLATLVFSGSLMTMVISTLQVVANSSKVSSFEEYSIIFRYFARHGKDIDTREPELKLILRSAFPYLSFIVSVLLTIFSINIAYQQILVYELLMIVTGAMACVVFFHFGCWKSPLILFTLSTRLISWSLVLLHIFQTWLPIPEFFFAFGWTIVSLPVFPGIYLDINLTTLIQIPLHVLLVSYFILRYSWKNFFTGLGPYLLFISWWIFCRYIFSHSSVFSLVIFVPGVISVLLFLPFLPLMIIMGPFIVMLYYGLSIQFLLSVFLLLFTGVCAILIMCNYQRLKDANWLNVSLDYVFLIHLVLAVSLVFAGTVYYNNVYNPSSSSSLDVIQFNDFNDLCKLDTTLPGNTIQSQLNCFHLKGHTIIVENAEIKEIKIKEVANYQVSALQKFPHSVRTALTCLMGETVPFCGNLTNSKTCISKGCHFDYKNHYTVNIAATLHPVLSHDSSPLSHDSSTLSHDSSTIIHANLMTSISHNLLLNSSLLKLKAKDHISFNATLLDGLGTGVLSLKLISFESDKGMKYEQSTIDTLDGTKQQVLDKAWESFVVTISFALEILIGFSPSEYYKPSLIIH